MIIHTCRISTACPLYFYSHSFSSDYNHFSPGLGRSLPVFRLLRHHRRSSLAGQIAASCALFGATWYKLKSDLQVVELWGVWERLSWKLRSAATSDRLGDAYQEVLGTLKMDPSCFGFVNLWGIFKKSAVWAHKYYLYGKATKSDIIGYTIWVG